MEKTRIHLLEIYQAALDAVSGHTVVRQELATGNYPEVFHIVAIGKAADAMVQGIASEKIKSGLLISKRGHISEKLKSSRQIHCIESAHPVPKQTSLKAGQALLDYLAHLPKNEPCLFLISGGASALVEVLQDEWDLPQLQALTDYLLANAYAIDEMNAVRHCISQIKGGGLWSFLDKRRVDCLMISDVPDDDPVVIGSGLLFPLSQKKLPELPSKWASKIITRPKINRQPGGFNWKIIASLADAKNAAAKKARELGYQAKIEEVFISGDAQRAAKNCVNSLLSEPGSLFIWGGETTVNLPENAGKGGRNQHLALAAAIEMRNNENMVLLAAGTDGSDGMTMATGAIVDGLTVQRGVLKALDSSDYLKRADSNSFFQKTDGLIVTGATGTNVMDLVIGIQPKKSPL